MMKLSEFWERCNSNGITWNTIVQWVALNIAVVLIYIISLEGYGFLSDKTFYLSIIFQLLFTGLIVMLPSYIKNQLETTKTNIETELDILKADISKQLTDVRKEIKKEFSDRIDGCPRMLAFHTEGNLLENKIKLLEESQQHKWLLSKFMSQMLQQAFTNFSFEIDSAKYSLFAKHFLQEAKSNIKLGGSFSPYEWLSVFKPDTEGPNHNKNEIEAFYNNEIEHYPILIGKKEDLHSYYLSNLSSIKSERYILLSEYDWRNLYLAERYLDEYYFLNTNNNEEKTLTTYFIPPEKINSDDMSIRKFFIEKETALYDEALLLEFDKNTNTLHCVTDLAEIQNAKKYYENIKTNKFFLKYDGLKTKVQEDKMNLLDSIIQNKKIPHTFSYLFKGADKWEEYCHKENDYISDSIDILHKGLFELKRNILSDNKPLKVVEIGPGTGEKINSIFDEIGRNIQTYYLIDVSDELLKKSEKKLREQKIKPENIHRHLIDICDRDRNTENELQKMVKDAFVIIQANSTLFTEDGFSFDIFSESKAIFITLDMHDPKKKHSTINFYYKPHILDLLLHPLRIFEIPIHTEIINDKKILDIHFDDANNRMKIIFKLKEYISSLSFNQKSILDKLSKSKSTDYINKRQELFDTNDLIVFDSLKFKNKDAIESYFAHAGFDAQVHIEQPKTCDFAAILLTKK